MKVELLTKYRSASSEVRVILLASNQDYRWIKPVFLPNTADREQNHFLGFPKADKFCDLNFEEEHKIRGTY